MSRGKIIIGLGKYVVNDVDQFQQHKIAETDFYMIVQNGGTSKLPVVIIRVANIQVAEERLAFWRSENRNTNYLVEYRA